MIIYKRFFYKNMIFFLLFLSILFRGPTFFKILPSSIGSIRISYLILFILCFITFFLLKYKIPIIEFFVFSLIFIIVLLNMLFLQAFNFEYLIYLLQVFMYYYILCGLIKIITINELFEKGNIILLIFGIMSVYEILSGKLFFHNLIPYEINNISSFDRAYLFFYNGNNLSFFLLTLYILLLGYNITEKNKTKYVIIYQFLLLFIFIMNDSKLSLFVFIISTLLVLYKRSFQTLRAKNWKTIFYGISSAIIIFFLIKKYINSNLSFFNAFFNSAKFNLLNDPRIDLYSSAIVTFYKNPLGIGLGNSDYYFSTNVHSIIFQFIVEFGLFGLIFWIFYYFLVMVADIRINNYNQNFIAGVIRYYLLIFPLISMQVSRVISDNALVFLWALFIALLKYFSNKNFKIEK
ncbi:O-antigen polymerase [Mesobacillus sp. AQ2]|uniref:O-antigen polymerase n=1 Tax=Mesobacillus sp. AQ2 TaxID=3043332 RepID=UPI0024C14B1F|nr:O-antigen polymerase [Mesobacillus sp. AQ2]WHX40386.1 O-antigen polymerase [Mesobacillus sp. AQ2]